MFQASVLGDVDIEYLSDLDDLDFDDENVFKSFCSSLIVPQVNPINSYLSGKKREAETEIKRRSKKGKPKHNGISVPADDIRRTYASSFANAMNSRDLPLLKGCLQKFCTNDLLFVEKFVGEPSKNNYAAMYREMTGIALVENFMDASFTALPDGIFTLMDAKLHCRRNNTSYIICKFAFTGTKCFSIYTTDDKKTTKKFKATFTGNVPVEVTNNNNTTMASCSSDSSCASSVNNDKGDSENGNSGSTSVVEHLEFVPDVISIAQETSKFLIEPLSKGIGRPVAVSVLGTLTYHINAEQRIFKMEFIHTRKAD